MHLRGLIFLGSLEVILGPINANNIGNTANLLNQPTIFIDLQSNHSTVNTDTFTGLFSYLNVSHQNQTVEINQNIFFHYNNLIIIRTHNLTNGISLAINLVEPNLFGNDQLKLHQPTIIILINESVFTKYYPLDNALLTLLNGSIAPGIESNLFIGKCLDQACLTVHQLIEIYSIKQRNLINTFSIQYDQYWQFNKTMRRSNFQKVPIVGAGTDDGYIGVQFKPNDTYDEFSGGFNIFIYRYLRDALNFSESALRANDQLRLDDNGYLIGVASKLYDGSVDIGVLSYEFLYYRVSAANPVSFLHVLFDSPIQVYFYQPGSSEIRDVFLHPFQTTVWMCILASMIFMSLVLTILELFSKYAATHLMSNVEVTQKISIYDNSFLIVASFCQQGWYKISKFISAQIAVLTSYYVFSIMFVAYSSKLVSLLSVKVIPINEYNDLIKYEFEFYSDNYIPTTQLILKDLVNEGVLPEGSIENHTEDVETKFYDITTSRTGIISISDSFYSSILKNGLTLVDQEDICHKIWYVPVGEKHVKSSMIVKKGSPLKGYFNYWILRMEESGVQKRLLNNYIKLATKSCPDASGLGGPNINVKISDIFTAHAIMACGTIFSLAFLLLELLGEFIKHKRKCRSFYQNLLIR